MLNSDLAHILRCASEASGVGKHARLPSQNTNQPIDRVEVATDLQQRFANRKAREKKSRAEQMQNNRSGCLSKSNSTSGNDVQ